MSDIGRRARGSDEASRPGPTVGSGADGVRSELPDCARDFDALRSVTIQDQPSVHAVVRAARERSSKEPKEAWFMFMKMFKSQPALATALTVVVLAVGLLVVPISYQRTTGYDVALSLAGTDIEQAQLMEIAQSYKETLGAEGIVVDALMEDSGPRYILRSPATGDVRAAASTFASELSELGYDASIEITPIKETVSSNVVAYAYGRIIEVSVDGKSPAELESEIRSRLAAAGVTAQVSVTRTDDNHQEIKLNAERQALGSEDPEAMPELVLTKGGQPITGGFGVNVMKKKTDASGPTTLVVKVNDEGKVLEAEVPNIESMSDAAIAASIEAQLAAAGLSAVVKVDGDQILVEKRKP